VLPTIEKLYLTWERASAKLRYNIFVPAITAAMDKLNKYYRLSAESDAHIMAMGMGHFYSYIICWHSSLIVLDPTLKLAHFRDYWEAELVSEVEELVQAKVCWSQTPSGYANVRFIQFIERFHVLQSNPSPKSPRIHKSTSARKSGRPNFDDTDSEDDRRAHKRTANPSKSWMNEWKAYINTIEDVPEDMEVVRWWGVSIYFLSAFITESCVVVRLPLPNVAKSCARLPRGYGLFSSKWTGLLFCRDHHQQAPKPTR
jgi:hypothetical protein